MERRTVTSLTSFIAGALNRQLFELFAMSISMAAETFTFCDGFPAGQRIVSTNPNRNLIYLEITSATYL